MEAGAAPNRKPVLFVDFDGTICHDRYWRSLPAAQQEQLQRFLFQDRIDTVMDWMRGLYSAEDINRMVAKALGLPFDQLWAVFVEDCRSMRVGADILARLSALRMRVNTVLITGNMDSFSRFTVPALGLDKAFDIISNSHSEGRLKTDDEGALFLRYTDHFGAAPRDCLLIDDSADVCATFERLGGRAYHVGPDRPLSLKLNDIEGDLGLVSNDGTRNLPVDFGSESMR